jgi:hypothetical protein
MFATVALVFALACSQAAEPSEDGNGCVTDLACAFGEECDYGACVPMAPSLYPHIQTASALLRPPLDDNEEIWRAQHFDLMIGGIFADEIRAVNPHARMFEYVITRYHRYDTGSKTASDWAYAHGYNPEDFYLHYRVDTDVPTWESTVIVPGYPAGRVPGWNPGGPNASATSRSQSRVVGYNYHNNEPWYFANLEHPGYRGFLAYLVQSMIDGSWWDKTYASGPIDGVMIDESIWYPAFGEGLLANSNEYFGTAVNDNHPYTYEVESQFPRLAEEMLQSFGTSKDMMPNFGHVLFLNYPNRCAQNIQQTTPWAYPEVWVSHTGTSTPTSGATRCITYDNDYVNAIREIVLQTRRGGRRVLGARDTYNGPSGTDRGKMLTLGLYYLVHNKHTYYMYESAANGYPTHVSTWSWNPAAQYDVGQPDVIPSGAVDFESKPNTKEHWVFASGPDPVNGALTYRVLARRFTNALVLVKLLPAGSTIDNASITTHALDGTYGVLQVDGLIGPSVTQASIRNNEALILIPLD